jgi:diguanylate cyclase (GGDEF)-like protein
MFKINFLRNILLASIAIIIILPLYDIFVAYPSFINALTEDAKDESVRIATHLISMLNSKKEEFDRDFLLSKQDTVEAMKNDLKLQKIKAFSPTGKTIYTTDPGDTKNIDKKEEFYKFIVKGNVYAEFKQRGMRSLEDHIVIADVVETYIPIMKGDNFLGAFEIYYDITSRKARLDKLRYQATVLVIVLASGLFVLLVITSSKASKNISERDRIEKELRALSLTDELTGLYNRRGFWTISEQQLKYANREKKGLLLLVADLDNLKKINDTLGHKEGDLVLVKIAAILKQSTRESDIIGRLGGDEFAILAMESPGIKPESLTIRIKENIDTFNAKSNKSYKLSLSMGMVHYNPDQPCSIEELISTADRLMYNQKRQKQ